MELANLKHTAGPWTLRFGTNVFGGDRLVANAGGHQSNLNGLTEGENIANAHLIAAAPDLLHALTMVRDADEDCKKDGLPTIPAPARACIDAALAKVQG